MDREAIKQEIHDTLKQVYFNASDDLVDVSDGDDDSLHLVIVSRKFDGHRLQEKNDLVWGLLTSKFSPDVWSRISLTVCTSPDEIKAS